jgi:hypothetical protein
MHPDHVAIGLGLAVVVPLDRFTARIGRADG